MSAPRRAYQVQAVLSRRVLAELAALQESVRKLGAERNAALQMLIASRYAATSMAQREFWLEFSWVDQEYRIAVQRLARFCADYREGSRRTIEAHVRA